MIATMKQLDLWAMLVCNLLNSEDEGEAHDTLVNQAADFEELEQYLREEAHNKGR